MKMQQLSSASELGYMSQVGLQTADRCFHFLL